MQRAIFAAVRRGRERVNFGFCGREYCCFVVIFRLGGVKRELVWVCVNKKGGRSDGGRGDSFGIVVVRKVVNGGCFGFEWWRWWQIW